MNISRTEEKGKSSRPSDQINYYRAITCDFRAVGSSDYVTKECGSIYTHIDITLSCERNNISFSIILFASTLSWGINNYAFGPLEQYTNCIFASSIFYF